MTGELKNHRLRKTWDFQRILRGRQKVYNENFVIFYQRNPVRESLSRFGISIPQRIVKKAVLRNKHKRQMRHILLELQRKRTEGRNNLHGWDFLIITREKFAGRDFNTKKDSLESLFSFFSWKVSNKSSTANKTLSRKQRRDHSYFEKTKDEA